MSISWGIQFKKCIFVKGVCLLKNVKTLDSTCKVQFISEEKHLIFMTDKLRSTCSEKASGFHEDQVELRPSPNISRQSVGLPNVTWLLFPFHVRRLRLPQTPLKSGLQLFQYVYAAQCITDLSWTGPVFGYELTEEFPMDKMKMYSLNMTMTKSASKAPWPFLVLNRAVYSL